MPTRRRFAATLFVIAFASSSLSASTLEEVRAQLQRLEATSPLEASVRHEVAGKSNDDPEERGTISVSLRASADELAIAHATEDLDRIRVETRDPDPERPRPATRAMDSIEPSDMAALIDFAPRLLRELDGARLVRRSSATRGGRSVVMLELELPVRLPADLQKRISSAEAVMKLWVTPAGIPVASERRVSGSGRFFFIRFSGGDSETNSYEIAGDRLVVTNQSRVTEGSGFGRSFREQKWTSLSVLRPPQSAAE